MPEVEYSKTELLSELPMFSVPTRMSPGVREPANGRPGPKGDKSRHEPRNVIIQQVFHGYLLRKTTVATGGTSPYAGSMEEPNLVLRVKILDYGNPLL